MRIQSSFTPPSTANRLARGPQPQGGNQEPRESFQSSSWLTSDQPMNPKTVAALGGGVGSVGLLAVASGLLTQQPGMVLGGVMASMVGFTVGYAALRA
jgi:hypothetical protein